MKSILTTTSFLLVLFSQQIRACSCAFFYDNFCQSVTDWNGNIWTDFHIYYVKVMSQEGTGIKVRVLNTYYGEALNGEEIFITSGQGFDCRVETAGFVEGKEHIFAAWKDSGGYGLSICGLTFLNVVDGMVVGNVAPGINEVPLSEFGELENCGFQVNPAHTLPDLQATVAVYPTLAREEVRLLPENWNGVHSLKLLVFDAYGKMVYQSTQAQIGMGNSLVVDTQGWASGVYFFKMNYLGRQETVRVVKAGEG